MSPTGKTKLRKDARGSGAFGAARKRDDGTSYTHKGIDLECKVGQNILMPCTGRITREARPYVSDPRWRGVYISAVRGEFKIFYMVPNDKLIGTVVREGEVIGQAQDIGQKYEGVSSHIHFEVVSLDPLILLNNE
jgi:hypothetical protein